VQVAGWRFFNSPIGLYPQLWCPPSTYSVYGQLFLQPLDVAVRSLFSFQPSYNHSEVLNTPNTLAATSIDRTSMPAQHVAAMDAAEEVFVFRTEALAAYTAFVWGMLLISYGIAAPTGIFIPSLAIGAAGGRLTGQLLRRALRSTGVMLPVRMDRGVAEA
jgi:chloride channel 7